MTLLGPARQTRLVALDHEVVIGNCHVDTPDLERLVVDGRWCGERHRRMEALGYEAGRVSGDVLDD